MKQVNVIGFNLKLPFTVTKKRKYWVSGCPVLDIFSQGETKSKALENLREAISMFLVSCYERNTLNEVMKESGFVVDESKTAVLPPEQELLEVPLPFIINPDLDTETCRA